MLRQLAAYWRIYGGTLAFAKSPFVWSALVLTVGLFRWWLHDDHWPDVALTILPPLLGFTLGAMAVVLAFPTSHIFKHLAEEGREDSYYAGLAARLLHFIIVQALGIIFSLTYKAYNVDVIAYVGVFFLF